MSAMQLVPQYLTFVLKALIYGIGITELPYLQVIGARQLGKSTLLHQVAVYVKDSPVPSACRLRVIRVTLSAQTPLVSVE